MALFHHSLPLEAKGRGVLGTLLFCFRGKGDMAEAAACKRHVLLLFIFYWPELIEWLSLKSFRQKEHFRSHGLSRCEWGVGGIIPLCESDDLKLANLKSRERGMHLPQRSADNRRTELTSLASTIRLNFELWSLSRGTGLRQETCGGFEWIILPKMPQV